MRQHARGSRTDRQEQMTNPNISRQLRHIPQSIPVRSPLNKYDLLIYISAFSNAFLAGQEKKRRSHTSDWGAVSLPTTHTDTPYY
eukprot:COSAG02_NODE_64_length_43111_cov_35.627709_34_plen_85_part_00